ncbi:MAG: hypothetical protein ABGZ17_02830, partial [Planctomycetaceae bacterium]
MSGTTTQLNLPKTTTLCVVLGAVIVLTIDGRDVRGDEPTNSDPADVPIQVQADFGEDWNLDGERVLLLRGHCRIDDGTSVLTARQMVVWHHESRSTTNAAIRALAGGPTDRLTVYLEDEVRLDRADRSLSEPLMLINMHTRAGVKYQVRQSTRVDGSQDPVFARAMRRRRLSSRQALQPTQLAVTRTAAQTGPTLSPLPDRPEDSELRRIRIFPRDATHFFLESQESKQTTPPEQIWVIKGGVNLLIDGIAEIGTVDLSADRMVIWTRPGNREEFRSETLQTRDTPFQVYMEGNIVVRQGKHQLRASRAFYDAREDRSLMLNAELKSHLPQLQTKLRIRAERIRQLSQKSFHAQNAWTSTSQFGKPGYRLQASDVFLEYRTANPWIGLQQPTVDPQTGAVVEDTVPWITSLNNRFLVEDFPVLVTPHLSTPAEDPNIPLRRASASRDSVFGTQIKTSWDLSKILGLNLPRNLEWNLDADYLSKRGPGVGTSGRYEGRDLWGLPGTYQGTGLMYYLHDTGEDNLGLDRRNLQPENSNRGRARLKHRQNLPLNVELFGEIGYLSDRNYLEQFHEEEFDEGKDNETLLYLKQDVDNWSWTALGRVRLNDFEYTTEWLPRADLYGLSEPLFGGLLTWTSHTSAGLARLRQADAPADPNDLFTALPYDTDASGAVLMTRHELDLPLNIGALNIVPFVMGEAAYWREDFNDAQIDRVVGRAGLRSSLLMWRVFPYVQSRILNLNGLAHKVLLRGEYSATDSSRDLNTIPQFNEFEDNSQERFRERLLVNSFGGVLPDQFEPRFYAVRSGSDRWVTAPYHELVDDQQVVRFSMRHRLQTKIGPPDQPRVRDWMVLEAGASYFPNPDRDNFSEDFGLIYGRYSWNVGQRTRLVSSALWDTFDNGQHLWNAGVMSQRTTRGSVYLGLRQIEGGTLQSRILTASYSYAMSPKWISTFGTAYDRAEDQNR